MENYSISVFKRINYPLIWACVFSIFTCSTVLFGQAPPLGTTENFAMFTQSGAFDNLGNSNITGDIGNHTGAFSGFPPGTLIGSTHLGDAASVQAANDIETAYAYLLALSCDSVIGASLGSNQTLIPNTYCIGSAAFLSGDLVLNGQGDPDALFIIKIDGALTSAAFAHIILTNATKPCNVYWQINGLFELGEQGDFKGTIVSNGAISLMEAASLNGRALSRAGAIALHNNIVSRVCEATTLPINLIAFEVFCTDGKAVVKWVSASESNIDYYQIQRSIDGNEWTDLELSKAIENSSSNHHYTFIDRFPLNKQSYYRLQCRDNNGLSKTSTPIVFIPCEESNLLLSVYPNPTKGIFQLSYPDGNKPSGSISVYNLFGELIYQNEDNDSLIDLSERNEGIYLLYLQQGSESIIKKIVLEK